MPITGTIGSNAINKDEITKIKLSLYIELKSVSKNKEPHERQRI